MKQCRVCSLLKAPEEFTTGQKRCKACTAIYMKDWADKNRKLINQNQLVYQTKLKGRANVLYNAALKRAKISNENFALTKADVLNGISSGYCSKTLFPFDFALKTRGSGVYSINPMSPSIDKIDPFGIYEPLNVQYVCSWYNLAKGQMSEDVLIEMCKRVVSLNP